MRPYRWEHFTLERSLRVRGNHGGIAPTGWVNGPKSNAPLRINIGVGAGSSDPLGGNLRLMLDRPNLESQNRAPTDQ
jgi:hypothetical protein